MKAVILPSKRELEDPEEVEAKKRKKKEKAEAFFQQQKLKKEKEKQERAEAEARGEVLPEKAAPAPLKEPPPLAPQVRAFAAAAVDTSVSSESLTAIFKRVMSARHEVASVSSEIAKLEECGTHQMRRKALLRTLVDRLRCVDDQTLSATVLSADPALAALRKGVAKSVCAFASTIPESFEVKEEANAKGKSHHVVRLIGSGPSGTSAASLDGSVGAELLVGQVVTTLRALGGSSTVSALSNDPAVRERAKGVASKFQKFLANHPDVFELTQPAEGGEYVCSVKAGAQGFTAAAAAAGAAAAGASEEERREALLHKVAAVLSQRDGSATMSDLGNEQSIKDLQKGVVAKLSKFLSSRPDVFGVTGGGELGGDMTVTLMAMPPKTVRAFTARAATPPAALTPVFTSDPRDLLLQTITSYLQEHGGEANVSDLGSDPAVKEQAKGVVAKISKFLAQNPDRFSVAAEGEKQQLVCRLLAS